MKKSNYFIEICDGTYGYFADSRIYMPVPSCEIDMEKALKKWYNHLCNQDWYWTASNITYYAKHELEDGTIEDLGMNWGYEQMSHEPSIPFC